jgi:tetratricopeptide (TPR) repeat protein
VKNRAVLYPLLLALALACPGLARASGIWHLDKCAGGGFMGWELAIDYCTRAIKSGDLSTRLLATAYYNRGVANTRFGSPNLGLRDLNEAIRLEAIAPEADELRALSFNARGSIHYTQRSFDAALADFEEAIRLDAKLGDAYLRRAQTWLAKRDFDRAIADFTLALKLDVPDRTLFSGGGSAYAGRPRNFDRTLHDSTAYHGRGLVYLAKNDRKTAKAEFDEALRVNPRSGPALKSRAQLYEAGGEYDLAIADYSNALRVNPRDAAAYFDRGRALSLKGEFRKGALDLDEALKLAPRHHPARALRAFIAIGEGRYDQASELLDTLMQHSQPQASLLLWRHVARARAADDAQRLSTAREELARGSAKLVERSLHAQILAFYLRPGDESALRAPGRSVGDACAADYFLAQHHLIGGEKARGAELLAAVAKECPPTQTESWAARLELQRLEGR